MTNDWTQITCLTFSYYNHYTGMFSVFVWCCTWIQFMHERFFPIYVIRWKSLYFKKNRPIPLSGHYFASVFEFWWRLPRASSHIGDDPQTHYSVLHLLTARQPARRNHPFLYDFSNKGSRPALGCESIEIHRKWMAMSFSSSLSFSVNSPSNRREIIDWKK